MNAPDPADIPSTTGARGGLSTALLDNLSEAVEHIDLDGRYLYINRAHTQLFGWQSDELIGKLVTTKISESAHSESFIDTLQFLAKERPKPSPLLIRSITKNGDLIDVRLSWNYICDAQDNVTSLVGVLTPVQDDDDTKALRASHSSLKLAVEAANLGTWEWNVPNDTWQLSPQATSVLKRPNADFVDARSPLLQSIHSTDADRIDSALTQFIAQATEASKIDLIFRLDEPPDSFPTTIRLLGRKVCNSTGDAILVSGTLSDITEETKTEDSLRRSEEIFRQLAENVEGVFWMRSHEDNSLIYVSPGYETLWGRPLEELFNNPSVLLDAIHPDDANFVRDASQDIVKSDTPFRYDLEYRICKPNEETKWISDHAFPILDPNGKIYRRAGFVTDITENKAAEDRLRVQTTALNAAANAIVITDPTGHILWVNAAFEKLSGYTPEEVIGEPVSILKSGEQEPEFYLKMWETISSGNVWRGEISNKRKDGRIYHEEMIITPVCENHGVISHYIAIKHDISDRIQQEENLRHSEHKYRTLFETAHDAIFLLDGATFTDCNQHAEDLFYCKREHIIGKSPWDFSPIFQPDGSDSKDGIMGHSQKVREGVFKINEWTFKRWDQSLFGAEVSLSLVNFEGNTRIQAIIRDTSARKKLENQILHSQKMEAVGQLAGGIAHDFNNLLMVILGYVDLLMVQVAETDAKWDYLKRVHDAANHAADLTNQLLAFSRQQVLQPKTVALNSEVEEATRMLQRLIPATITITTNCAPDAGFVRADPGQLRQILVNLMVNARDAMPTGGTLTIESHNATITTEQSSGQETISPGDYVVLSISDTGTGIDNDQLRHIFDPFYTTKSKGRGTGLGLATVYGIVKQSGGDILVDSTVGQGTTFSIYMPRDMNHAVAAPAGPAQALRARSSGRILLIEDESSVRILVEQVLKKGGYDVHATETPTEALEYLANTDHTPDLVISDVVLPEMNGPEMVRQMLRVHPDLKVLFTSGYSDTAELTKGAEFLQKPYGADDMLNKVSSMIPQS